MSTQALSRPMPEGLEALPDLALNVRWSWSHAADRLWQRLSPEIWAETRNPWLILQLVSQASLEEHARDPDFVAQVARLAMLRAEYLGQPGWQHAGAQAPLVAYFCLEFGLTEALPLYAGGLGILAGDQLKTASDLGVPMIGVGLLYSQGYFRQMLDADGTQHELYPPTASAALPIAPALDSAGVPLSVVLALPGRNLLIRVWQVRVGRATLLLLDCNDPRNGPGDRGITANLYPAEPETRLVQQLVLGIGGWRALAALGLQPQVCHINEGPAALAALERIRERMLHDSLSFQQALWATRPGNVFTSHTPVAAAFDTFPAPLMLKYLNQELGRSGIEPEDFLALGRTNPAASDEPFNPACFGLRVCGSINAVSRIHRDVSRLLYQQLFPRRPAHEVPIGHITNGVHVPSWDSAWADELWTQACGKGRWLGDLCELAPAITALDDRTLWELRSHQRRDLIGFVRERLVRQLHRRGQDGALAEQARHMLDPNVLTLGFARRFTSYKRPNLLLHEPDRLARLLGHGSRPVQLIVAGKAHPQDEAGKNMLRQWVQFMRRPDVRPHVVFLEDYDIDLAHELVQGVDVWLNTPRRPWEACGTSGMKVLVNGGLNLSERDGWWAEAYAPEVGWQLDGAGADDAAQDRNEAEALYRLLEDQVVPLFYQRNADGLAEGWVKKMRASMAQLAPRFSSNRMLREYVETAYSPAAAALARRSADGARLARELDAWASALRQGWHQIHFGNFQCRREGGSLHFSLHTYLGEIVADTVAVELYADAPAGGAPMLAAMRRGAAIGGASNGHVYEAELQTDRPPGHFTPRLVPFHEHAAVPLELGLVYWGVPVT